MSKSQKTIAHKPNGSTQAFEENFQRVTTQAIVDLCIARRCILIYPISHEQVKRSLIRSYKTLTKVIGIQNGILTLTVIKDRICINDKILESNHATLMDFAGVLKHYEIAMVVFRKGLKINELVRFVQFICIDLHKVLTKGGLDAAVRDQNFTNIEVQTIDYSKLQLTEEQEIQSCSTKPSEQRSIWQQFVKGLMASKLNSHKQDDIYTNPGWLADMLNQKTVDINQAVDFYHIALSKVETSGTGKKKLTKELMAFQQLINELDADLKMQFLSATFDNYGQRATFADAVQLIDGLGGGRIIQMIRQANSQGKKISPSLMAFVKKMRHAHFSKVDIIHHCEDGDEQKKFSSQNLKSLLAHEKYETYVDDDYGSLLSDLTQDMASTEQKVPMRSLAQEIKTDLTPKKIYAHVGQAIARLMTCSKDISMYRDWARQLTFLFDDLLESLDYGYLNELITFVRREKQHENQQRATIANLVLAHFSDSHFVGKAVKNLQAHKGGIDPEAVTFFKEIGEPVVIEILDGFDPYRAFDEQGAAARILQYLDTLTVQEALHRIKDPNSDYVCSMIRIIRKMGDSECAQQIRSLTDHNNLNVRIEALETLLKFNNKWGQVRLQSLLDDPLGESFAKAVRLAGQYKVISTVSQLECIAIQRREPELREIAIRALGRIGDPRAIITLSKIARRRWGLVTKYNSHLKWVVFDSLDGYPRNAIQDLVRYGLKQKDPTIQSACRRLLQKGE